MPCPDQRLKATVLQDFILLDAKHLERLEELEDKHADLTMYVIFSLLAFTIGGLQLQMNENLLTI